MRRPHAALLRALVLVPAAARAQQVTIGTRGSGQAAAFVDSVTARPHVVRAGTGPLVFPRDTAITSSLLVLGQQTYLASTVRGDVVVIGGDLFLRPGADISGRAVAIGGTVAETTLGRVGGSVVSLRDESFDIERNTATGNYRLVATRTYVEGDKPGVFRLAGVRGVQLPSYDRVNGLSLPLAVQLVLGESPLLIQPSVTYRSRLGVVDPGVLVRLGDDDAPRLEARAARTTRSNDLWITSELINSLKTLAFGTDTRNYFRSDIGEARLFAHMGSESSHLEPYVGGRFENVSPVSATGDVFAFVDRTDSLKIRRPNPAVERGHIASALLGGVYESLPRDAPVASRLQVELEQSFTAPAGRNNFTQLTADGRIEFPTIGTQGIKLRAHAVGTLGDSVPRARYAYLGGSRTLGLSDLLSLGGTDLVFVDTRYLIPIERVQLPVVGPPTLSLIHRIGGAGVGSVGTLLQEVGVGLSLGPPNIASIDFELITGASGQKKTQFGVGVSLSAF
jgi:hypothetical protein